jgi:hypothetical protein
MINLKLKKRKWKFPISFSYGKAYTQHFEDAQKNWEWYLHQERQTKQWQQKVA